MTTAYFSLLCTKYKYLIGKVLWENLVGKSHWVLWTTQFSIFILCVLMYWKWLESIAMSWDNLLDELKFVTSTASLRVWKYCLWFTYVLSLTITLNNQITVVLISILIPVVHWYLKTSISLWNIPVFIQMLPWRKVLFCNTVKSLWWLSDTFCWKGNVSTGLRL